MENVTNHTHKDIKLDNDIIIPANTTVPLELPTNKYVIQLLRMGLISITPAHKDVTKFATVGKNTKKVDSRKESILARRQAMLNAEKSSKGKTTTRKGSSSNSK